jgi:hypothetical protein
VSFHFLPRRCAIRSTCGVLVGLLVATSCTFKPEGKPLSGSGATGMGGIPIMTGAGGSGAGGSTAPPPPTTPCTNLQCQQTTCKVGNCTVPPCAGGGHTTVSGTVYDPAGKVPLYNVIVYVPNAPLGDFTDGASCDRCDTTTTGNPIVKATTDAAGNFTLADVPVGSDIPLVMQVGKWRRAITIPSVAACADTPLADKDMTRLPRNQSEGHLPKMALTTGHYDALECLLRKVGIDDAEFTTETGAGRINLFNGTNGTDSYAPTLNGGAMFTPAPTWWESQDNLMGYDMILHSCEGVERSTNKSVAARQALQNYANAGGRVFASHWHNYWIEFGPQPFPTVAHFDHQNDPPSPFTATIDTSFPRGMAMAEWLMNVGGSTTPGQLVIVGAKHTVDSVMPAVAQRWIYSDTPASVQYFSFNTPVGAASGQECGKIVFSDLHLSGAVGTMLGDDKSDPTLPFPTGCVTTDLTPQEKALEFMLFDLSACLDPVVQ